MKLIGLTIFAAAANAEEFQLSGLDGLVFDKTDAGYEAFSQMELEVDSEDSGLEIGIHERGKVGTGKSSIEKMQLRKYETIKKMTLYLHDEDEREWGRYCPYGCHCAVKGPHDLLAGTGQPLDEVDSACKRHKECIACALKDFDQATCPWWKPYKMAAMIDDETNEKHLVCQDKPGYCKRALCECDAQFARDLYEQRMNYNRDNHHRYGDIDVEEQCKAVNRGSFGAGQAGKGVTAEHQCCGNNPQRFPYNPAKNECCDGKISGLGSC